MNKFKIGDKVVCDRDNPDYVFEICIAPNTMFDNQKFKNTTNFSDFNDYKFKYCKEPYEKEFIESCYRLATQEEIDTMWKKQEQDEHDSKTQSQDKIVCPYCFYSFEQNDIELDDLSSFNHECFHCQEEYRVTVHIETTYSTSKSESQSNKN